MARRNPQGRVPSAVTMESPQVLVVQGEHATVAVYEDGDEQFVGEAKRCPGDARDPLIARDLAVGRALQRYGDHLVSRALREAGVVPEPEPSTPAPPAWADAVSDIFRRVFGAHPAA